MARLTLNPLAWWRRFLALPNESPAKGIGLVLIVALVCAAAVTVAAISVRPIQVENAERERQARLFALLDAVPGLAAVAGSAQATALDVLRVDLATGSFSVVDGMLPTAAVQDVPIPAAEDIAGLRRRPATADVYLLRDGNSIALLVLPVEGRGYQSTIKAYLALAGDLNTVAALSVYEQGETPGLGARITDDAWQALWPGRLIADETGAIRIDVVRGQGVGPYEIDGITGATRTSEAASNMVRFWLGDWGFGPFLAALRQSPGVTSAESPPGGPPAVSDGTPADSGPGTATHFLGDRHMAFGATCASCHGAGIPAAGTPVPPASTTSMCLTCHGTFGAIAARTSAVFPNPHASHFGDLACGLCHRAHQQSVDYCAQCHAFGFVVP